MKNQQILKISGMQVTTS